MTRSAPPFGGVGVALVSLFDDDGALDVAATLDHAERVVDAGVRAVLLAGSTGEAPALTAGERRSLITAARRRLPDHVPVIAGTGDVTAERAADLTRDAADAGADALLALSPLRANDPRPYYERVRAAAGDLPLLAYHFPAMSPPGIPLDVLADLDVDGLKDSSGDPARLLAEAADYDGAVYCGSAALALQAGALGCAGAILALANLEPAGCVAAFGGDGEAQLALASPHARTSGRFPHALKEALAERYGTSTVTRMG